MKNTFLIKMIISCSIGLAIFSTSYAEPKLRDNRVRFLYEDITQPEAIFKITDFTVESYSITPGQPWSGVSISGTNELNVRAGRQGSSVNNDFLRSHGYHVNANGSGNNVNFAIIGNLSFSITSPYATSTYTCSTIGLRQAHEGEMVFDMTNIWSFYANNKLYSHVGPTTITCQNTQTHTINVFKVRKYTINSFIISPPAID